MDVMSFIFGAAFTLMCEFVLLLVVALGGTKK